MSPEHVSIHLRVIGLILAFSLRLAAEPTTSGEPPTTTAKPTSSIDFAIGVVLSLIGSLFSNFGVNIQKYSQMKDAEQSPDAQTAYYKQPRWVVGFLLVVLGSVGDFSALKFAAQSIVAPLAAVSLISNVFFAHFWLGETLSHRDIGGTALVVLGCVVSVAFGDHSEQVYTLDDLLTLFEKSLFIVYAIVIVGLGSVIYLLLKVRMEPLHAALLDALSPQSRASSPSQPARTKTLGDAAPDHVGAIDRYQITPELASQAPGRRMSLMMGMNRSQQTRRETKEHVGHLKDSYKKWETLHPIAYCALSGLMGGQSLLFAKSTVLMLNATFAGDNQFTNWQTYIFILSLLFCIFSQLHFLAMALKYFDVMFVVPVFQTWFIGISTLGGIFYFREFEAFKPLQFFLFPFGLLLTLLGVFILSSSRPPSFDLPDEEEEEGRASRPSFTPTVVVEEEGDEGDGFGSSLPARAPRVQKRRPTVFGSFAPAAMATNAGVRPGLGNLAEWEKRVANRFPQRKMKKRHSLPAQRGGVVLASVPPTTESIEEETVEDEAVAGRDRLSTIRESIGARERPQSSASVWDNIPGRESRAMTYA